MKALIVDSLLDCCSLQQFDELVRTNDSKGRNRLDMTSFATHVDACYNEASAGIHLYIDLLTRLSESNSTAVSYLHFVEPIINRTSFFYSDLLKFNADADGLIKKDGNDLKQIHNGLTRRCYERMILGDFLSKLNGMRILPSATVEPLLSDSDCVSLEWTKAIEHIAEDLCAKQALSLSAVNDLREELSKLVDLLSALRKEMLQVSLQSTSVSFSRIIEDSASITERHGFGAALTRAYGDYLSEQILFSPGRVFGNYLSVLQESFRHSFELAKIEREVITEFKIPTSWCISPKLMRLERLSILAEITSDPKTACLLATYYERPVFLEYDLEKSLFWATAALTQGCIDSLPAIATAELSTGDPQRAITALKKHFRETDDSESAYLLACGLLNKSDQKHFEFELAKGLINISAQNHHPAALCLTAFFSRELWHRTGADSDLASALSAYKKSANLEFGLAKIALEEFELDGWQSSDDDDSNTLSQDLTGNATDKELFAYLKAILRRKNSNNANLDQLKEIARQKRTICFDFIIGQILNMRDPWDPESFDLIEKSAREGHPDACAFLSKHAEKEKKFSEAIFWEEHRLKNDVFFKSDSRELHPFARLHALKVANQASLSFR